VRTSAREKCNSVQTVNCARDHSTLRVTGSTSSVQFSERGLRQSYGIKCECDVECFDEHRCTLANHQCVCLYGVTTRKLMKELSRSHWEYV